MFQMYRGNENNGGVNLENTLKVLFNRVSHKEVLAFLLETFINFDQWVRVTFPPTLPTLSVMEMLLLFNVSRSSVFTLVF